MFVIEYKTDGMLIRRSYEIGKGSKVEYPKSNIYNNNFAFIHEFSYTENSAEPSAIRTTNEDIQNIWHCPHNGCTREFKSVAAMRKHTNYESCTYQIRCSSMDVVKQIYADKIDIAGETTLDVSSQPSTSFQQQLAVTVLPMGFALKARKPKKRFSKPMLNWVKEYFLSGEMTGKKVTGEELNRLQRVAVDEKGEKMFPISEYKTDIQFKSLL